jgi:capsular polysaccharide biosynthesis protein
MSNFKKLRLLLEKNFGFQTYFVGSMSFEEIAAELGAAKIVVAEYGAGLANIIFTPPGAKIIEIRGPSESTAIEYEMLVKALGHEHFKVIGKSQLLSLTGIGNGQFSVKVDLMKRFLGGILEKP